MHACLVIANSLQPHGDCQAPHSMGLSQQEYWSVLLFPSQGYLLDQGSNPLAGRFFTTELSEKLLFLFSIAFFFPLELYFCWYDCRDKTLSPLSHQSVRKGICCSDIDVGTPVYSWLVFVWCNFFCTLLSFFLYPYIGQVSLVSIIKKIQCVNVCLFLLEYSVYLHLI